MNKINKYFLKSNKGILVITMFVLLCVYGYTVSSFLASVPSEGFSREVEIGQVISGEQININSHVETLVISEEEVLVTAVDNHSFKLITINRLGETVEEISIDLDLYNASNISASIDEPKLLSLYVEDVDLYRVLIDLETYEFTREVVALEVENFIRTDNMIVFQQETGLYGMEVNNHQKVLPLILGPIKSFALTKESDESYHLFTTVKNGIAADIYYTNFGSDIRVNKEFILRENTGSNYIQRVKAIDYAQDILTVVFVWSDNKYGANNITVHQYDTTSGELLTDYRHEFSMHKGRYIITNVKGEEISLLLQDNVHYGVNIVEAIMSPKELVKNPLTKTRKLSFLSRYFEFGEDQALVFFDLDNNDKVLYYASSNEELIDITTKATTIDPVRIIGLIFIVIFQSAFTSAVFYLAYVALGPIILLLILNKLLPRFKNKIYIQSAICMMIHTGLKIYLTYRLINVKFVYQLIPPFIGGEPYIYFVMILLSLFSYYLMTRYIKWNMEYDSTPVQGYLNFVFYEYVSYTLIVYIYISTYLVINKI